MADKVEYNSTHDGPSIDAAVTQAKPGGTLDSRLRLSLYTSLEQIGVTVGSETMEAIALALPNNSILEASCGGDNNGAADGSAFPVVSGAALTSGILRVSRVGSYDRVSFEFCVKEAASRLFIGFYSSTDGWSGWKKVYTDSSKPTAAELNAANLVHASRHKRGGEDPLTFSGVAFLGENPIASPSDDTPQKWGALGSGYCFYNAASQLNDQPSQYGFILSISYGIDISQIWRTQPGGPTYWRSGSALGWNGTWAKAYDSNVVPTFTQFSVGSYTGTGYATSVNAPTLTFPFNPKFVFVMSLTDGDLGNCGYFLRDIGGYVQKDSFHIPSIEWADKTLHYYTTDSNGPAFALNSSGVKYGYVAFG